MKIRVLLMSLAMLFGLMVQPYNSKAAVQKSQLLVINKKINQIAFFENGKLIKTYSVGTGKTPRLTPEGSFFIREKVVNRPYYKLKIKGGDPRNPLGDRWMGLSAKEHGSFPYGIHGTNNERSIGKYVSGGCIRMHNKDVRELFGRVQKGTRVVITNSRNSFAVIAQPYIKTTVAKK